MSGYAKTTRVPVSRSRAQIDDVLRKWGCDQIGWRDDFKRGIAIIEFVWEHEGADYGARLKLVLPESDQEIRASYRVLLLWLTACFNAVDAGLIDAETIFLPFLVGPDGKTVAETALPRMKLMISSGARAMLGLPEFVE